MILGGIGFHPGCKSVSGYCYHCCVLGAIITGCVDVCLEKKKGKILGSSKCWVSAQWKQEGKSVETVEPVVVGLLQLGGNSWQCLCGNLLGLASLGNGVRCVGSYGKNWIPHGQQNELPPMVNIMQIINHGSLYWGDRVSLPQPEKFPHLQMFISPTPKVNPPHTHTHTRTHTLNNNFHVII